jgi:hypothetical protein
VASETQVVKRKMSMARRINIGRITAVMRLSPFSFVMSCSSTCTYDCEVRAMNVVVAVIGLNTFRLLHLTGATLPVTKLLLGPESRSRVGATVCRVTATTCRARSAHARTRRNKNGGDHAVTPGNTFGA